MNLNQAKKIAGIAPHEPIAGRASLEAAMRRCVAGIVEARRRGDDDRAAELSEAKEVFRRRLHRNTCAVCGVTIGRGATHCAAHQRSKAKALPSTGPAAKPEPKGNGNARVSIQDEPHALLGYYTAPVQKVVAKWREQIGEAMLRRLFEPVAVAVIHRETELNLPFVAPQHWPAVFDLGQALAAVVGNTRRPAAWLLQSQFHVASDGNFPSWAEIREEIRKQGGPVFTVAALAQAAKEMKLATPKPIAREWRAVIRK